MLDDADIDAVVRAALAQPYKLDVPEERERLVKTVQGATPSDTPVARIRAAVRRIIAHARAPTASSSLSSYVPVRLERDDLEAGLAQSQPLAASRASEAVMRLAIDAEVDRVLLEIRDKIRDSLHTKSYEDDSSADTNEWFVCVRVRYHPAASRAVEEEVQGNFSRAESVRKPLRPYYRSHVRYNVNRPLSVEPKQIFITAFFFQWLQNPASLPPSQTPVVQPHDGETAPANGFVEHV